MKTTKTEGVAAVAPATTCIATTDGKNREANARAIAAVPLMFAALDRLGKACNAVHEVSGGTPQHEAMWLAQLEARDAITEATGIPWQNVKEHLPPRSGSKNKQDASGG